MGVLELNSISGDSSQGNNLEEKTSEFWKILNVNCRINFNREKRKRVDLRKTVK